MESSNGLPTQKSIQSSLDRSYTGQIRRREFLGSTGAIGGAAGISLLAGCLGDDDDDDFETVIMASTMSAGSMPTFVGLDQDVFRDHGINLELERMQSASEEVPRLSRNQIQCTTGALSASILNSYAEGFDIKCAGNVTTYVEGRPSPQTHLVHPDVYEDGMRYEDTGGLTWALNAEHSLADYNLARNLNSQGLTLDDVEIETMAFGDMISAMENHAVDACMTLAGIGGTLMAQEMAYPLAEPYAQYGNPGEQGSVILLSPDFIEDRYDTAVNLVAAYAESVRNYYEIGPYSEEMERIYEDHLDDDPGDSLRQAPPLWGNRNIYINTESLERQQRFWSCQGALEPEAEELDIDGDVVDSEIEADALERIGEAEHDFVSDETWEEWMEIEGVDLVEPADPNPPEDNGCGGTGI